MYERSGGAFQQTDEYQKTSNLLRKFYLCAFYSTSQEMAKYCLARALDNAIIQSKKISNLSDVESYNEFISSINLLRMISMKWGLVGLHKDFDSILDDVHTKLKDDVIVSSLIGQANSCDVNDLPSWISTDAVLTPEHTLLFKNPFGGSGVIINETPKPPVNWKDILNKIH